MRMWNVEPKFMCVNHLMGEHLEMHMFVGTLKKGVSVKGYVENGLVEIHNIKKRHDELAKEIVARGFNHKSNLKFNMGKRRDEGSVNRANSLKILRNRCAYCRNLQLRFFSELC